MTSGGMGYINDQLHTNVVR